VFNTVRFSALARVCAVSVPILVAGLLTSVSPVATGAAVTYASPACSSFALSGTPPNQTLTCVSGGGGGGGGVPVCTPSATKTAPAIGQSTTISANCSGSPTSYVWTGGGCTGITASTCTVTKSMAKTVVFTVQGSNPAGWGVPAEITITWR
jgi:hypothetical protein